MADSLDDFFAKKDKKKKEKKTTGKFTVAEDVSKNSEEPSKTTIEKPKKNVEKNNVNASGFVSKNHDQDESEWKDISEEKDYSGLRIQSLNIKDKEEELREQKALDLDQENKSKEEKGGPWAGMGEKPEKNHEDHSDQDDDDIVIEEPKSAPEPVKAAGPTKYVPPGQRAGATGGSSSTTSRGPGWKGKGKAPEIGNAEEFPTLGDGPPPELSKDYQPVRHGARDLSAKSGPQSVSIGNKFNALSSNRESSN